MGEFINMAANAVALTVIMPITLFIYFYATKKVDGKRHRVFSTLWRSTEIGRTLMYQNIAWFVFLILITLNLTLEEYWGKEVLRFIIYTALVLLFWRALFTLRRVQKRKVLPFDALRETEIEQTKPRLKKK